MNDLLEWLGFGLAGLVGVAVLVAGWEHLAREARCALRGHGSDARHQRPGQVQVHVRPVDLALDSDAVSLADTNASRTAMTQALNRAAAARPLRDASPWLDTCPQVTHGSSELVTQQPAPSPSPSPLPLPLPLPLPSPSSSSSPSPSAPPAPSPMPAAAPATAATAATPAAAVASNATPTTAPQSTIERAALR